MFRALGFDYIELQSGDFTMMTELSRLLEKSKITQLPFSIK